MMLRYQENSDIQPYITLMRMLRTKRHAHSLYELIKLHLWGFADKNQIYYSISLLHDDDFVFLKLNLKDENDFHYVFAMTLEQLVEHISPEIKEKFLKDTIPIEKSMLLWRSQSADSV
jgi:hypothetical protein